MKFLDFVKGMTKGQKIILASSVSAVIVVMAIMITVIVNNHFDKVETTSSQVSNLEVTKGNVDETIEDVEEIEEAVVLQNAEETSEEQLEKEQVKPEETKTGTAMYYIKVNYGANTVTVYGKDEAGNYTVPVKAMICSCGISTPKSGVYKTSAGYRWGTLIGGVYGQYSTRIVGNILFHSVPYTAQSSDSLEYWEFDKLGTKASAGCVRLMVADAQWIYNNCRGGTMVEFYSSADPGPLGKPGAPKISGNERCRGWDPTDSAAGNPWRDEVQEDQTEEVVQEQATQVEEPLQEQENKITANQNKTNPNNQSKSAQNKTEKPKNTSTNPINSIVNNSVGNTVTPPVSNTVISTTDPNTPNQGKDEENKGDTSGDNSSDNSEDNGNNGDNESENTSENLDNLGNQEENGGESSNEEGNNEAPESPIPASEESSNPEEME